MSTEKPKKERSRYKPLPRRGGEIDREKMRAEYLAANHYDIHAWIKEAGYDPLHSCFRNHSLPILTWKREWLDQRLAKQNEGNVPHALQVRERIIQARLTAVERDLNAADQMEQVFKGMLALYQVKVTRSLEKAKTPGESFDIPDDRWQALTKSYENIQNTRARALFYNQKNLEMPDEAVREAINALQAQMQANAKAASDEGQKTEVGIEPVLIGMDEVPMKDLEQAITRWFDTRVVSSPTDPMASAEKLMEKPTNTANVVDAEILTASAVEEPEAAEA